jgi:hypothetical protein
MGKTPELLLKRDELERAILDIELTCRIISLLF